MGVAPPEAGQAAHLGKAGGQTVGVAELPIRPAVPHLYPVQQGDGGGQPGPVPGVLEGVGQHCQPPLAVDDLHRLEKIAGVHRPGDKQPQQVAQLGGHLHAGYEEEAVIFRRLGQGQVVVAHRRAVQAPGLYQGYDLVQRHDPVGGALGVDVQV